MRLLHAARHSDRVVIVLNGASGAGKTTVGRILAGRARNGACVHGDDLRDFIVSRVDDEVELGLGYVNAATVAANFVRGGYQRVVVDYVFEAERHVQRFRDAFDGDARIVVVALTRNGSAVLPGEVVDAAGLTPEQVADRIEALL